MHKCTRLSFGSTLMWSVKNVFLNGNKIHIHGLKCLQNKHVFSKSVVLFIRRPYNSARQNTDFWTSLLRHNACPRPWYLLQQIFWLGKYYFPPHFNIQQLYRPPNRTLSLRTHWTGSDDICDTYTNSNKHPIQNYTWQKHIIKIIITILTGKITLTYKTHFHYNSQIAKSHITFVMLTQIVTNITDKITLGKNI